MIAEEPKKDTPEVSASKYARVVEGLKEQFADNTQVLCWLADDNDHRLADFLQCYDLAVYNDWRRVVLAVRPGAQFKLSAEAGVSNDCAIF